MHKFLTDDTLVKACAYVPQVTQVSPNMYAALVLQVWPSGERSMCMKYPEQFFSNYREAHLSAWEFIRKDIHGKAK